MNEINVSTSANAVARLLSSKNIDNIEQNTVRAATQSLLKQLILQHVQKMNPQSVANCLHSLGKIIDFYGIQKKPEYDTVFETLCERAMVVCNEMKTQNASNILWAMAKFRYYDVNLIKKLVKQAINTSKKQFKPQELCNLLWSMATLKYCDISAIQHFVELSKLCLKEMHGQEVANLMWALQQLRYYDQQLCFQIEDNIINNKNIVFQSQNISNIMLAFTDFGLQNKQKIIEILVQKFLAIKVYQLQHHSNFLYSLALLDCPLSLSQKVVDNLLTYQNKFQDFMDIQLRQIQLAQIFYNIKGQKLYFPSILEHKCKVELEDYVRKQTLVQNSFLDVVFNFLKSHFDFAQRQALIYDGQIEIHIALQQGEKTKVAVRVNPKQSYFVNQPEKLLGRCQHQVFLLEQLDWQVVEVSAFEWSNPLYQQQLIKYIQEKQQII